MRRADVEIGHKRISYLVAEPSAPADRRHPVRNVVFLHAFPLQAAMWEPTLDAVPDGWRAIAPDYRGFGGSPLPDSGRVVGRAVIRAAGPDGLLPTIGLFRKVVIEAAYEAFGKGVVVRAAVTQATPA